MLTEVLIKLNRTFYFIEIANVCLFLASEESSYVNCAAIEVTGKYVVFPMYITYLLYYIIAAIGNIGCHNKRDF